MNSIMLVFAKKNYTELNIINHFVISIEKGKLPI